MRSLTAKQDTHARNVASGMTQTGAYSASYDAIGMHQEMVYIEASRLAANPKIALRSYGSNRYGRPSGGRRI